MELFAAEPSGVKKCTSLQYKHEVSLDGKKWSKNEQFHAFQDFAKSIKNFMLCQLSFY